MEILLHKSFLRQFKKIPQPTRAKFVDRKNLFIKEPFNQLLNNHSVGKAYPGCRSLNVTGDYRAIFQEVSPESVVFLYIGTHSELYG